MVWVRDKSIVMGWGWGFTAHSTHHRRVTRENKSTNHICGTTGFQNRTAIDASATAPRTLRKMRFFLSLVG